MQAAGIGRFLHDELGMEVQGLLTHSAKGMENVPAWCSFLPEKEKLDLLRGSTGTLVLGSDETLSQAPAGNTLVQIGFPQGKPSWWRSICRSWGCAARIADGIHPQLLQ